MLNYQREMEREIKDIPRGTPLLLHACCGPCSTAVLARLCHHFAVTVYYYNPNMDTPREYLRRQEALRQLLAAMPDGPYPLRAVYADYDPAPFLQAVRGLEEEPEGGARCAVCFELRLEETARMAAQLGMEWVCTTLTVSPHKNAEALNKIGTACAQRHHVRFLPADFKKKDGYHESIRLSARYGLYRQDYCGCAFSRRPDGL